MKRLFTFLLIGIMAISVSGCGNSDTEENNNTEDSKTVASYQEGVYKVEADAFDERGWKPFIELTIKEEKISNVVFDYKDESGNLKTADAEYKKNMEAKTGTYPEKYSKELVQQLLDKQDISQVDVVTGATKSSKNFSTLVQYALDDMAEVGDTQPALIKLETE